MSDRTEDVYKYYVCGRCKTKIEYLANEEPPVPCPDCGWGGLERGYKDIKFPIKMDLNQF